MGGMTEVSYFTHNGGFRVNNEDSLLIGTGLITNASMEQPLGYTELYQNTIFCVADGIGGESKGEVASRIVLSGIREYQESIIDQASLSGVLYRAKGLLESYVKENPEARNLGCTLAGLCIRGDKALVFNVGDCRVYRINGHFFEQLTRDHSVVQSLFDEGIITEDEMRHHPRRNVITSSVSGDGIPDSIHLYSTRVHIRADETFFICCDGIWGSFSHDELEIIYQRFQGLEYCEQILGAAIARNASDNISAILVHINATE